jgi:uncharacterized iron-regulated membrane protein
MQGTQTGIGAFLGPVFLLFKAIGGGVLCLMGMWVGILVTYGWWVRRGETGLGAIAGGWAYLLQLPVVVTLLTIAFGIGFYAAIRWSLR